MFNKNTKNSNLKSLALVVALGTFGMGHSQAALHITIADAGPGVSRFELAGSTTVTGDSTETALWFAMPAFTTYHTGPFLGFVPVSNNTGSVFTTFSGSFPITFVYMDDGDFAFALYNGNSEWKDGDTISISGGFDIALDHSAFADIAYDSNLIKSDSSSTTSENTIITGSPIPEPSSTALLGLGGLALMLRRRR